MKEFENIPSHRFAIAMEVRDYEVDYQGIVNNANYLHYMEHTRHQFCQAEGLTFEQMHRQGIDPVLARADIHYKAPLHMGDHFISCLDVERRGPKFVFKQYIYLPDGTPVIRADIYVACIENGHLTRGEVLAKAFNIQ